MRPSPLAAALSLAASVASAQQAAEVLDASRVVHLAREHAPAVTVAEARVREARAHHVGALAYPHNPDVSLVTGPRFTSPAVSLDVVATVTFPLDLAGIRTARDRYADRLVLEADAACHDAERTAVGEALVTWAHLAGAERRVVLARARVDLDEQLHTVAQRRFELGTAGAGDATLASVVLAEDGSVLAEAQGEREALACELRAQLGLAVDAPLTTAATDAREPMALADALRTLDARPDLARLAATVETARVERDVEQRSGVPVPRISLGGGRDNEYVIHASIDMPVPIFQRNQTAVAVAEARVASGRAAVQAARTTAEGTLRAAYARWQGAREALRVMLAAQSAIDESEHLVVRAYQLGTGDLASALVARRESLSARARALDATDALDLARITLDLATGRYP